MVFRYVLEELSEQQLLEIDRGDQIANTSVTRYELSDDGRFQLVGFNGVDHLDTDAHDHRDADAPVTEENDVPSPA
jgi:hypothetical protein